MRYFSQKDWEAYQAARKTPATERGFVKELDFEAGRETLRRAGVEILPSAPSKAVIISRRPWLKNFDGVVIRPEDAIERYGLKALMDDPLDDVKKLLNIVFGEGKDGGN